MRSLESLNDIFKAIDNNSNNNKSIESKNIIYSNDLVFFFKKLKNTNTLEGLNRLSKEIESEINTSNFIFNSMLARESMHIANIEKLSSYSLEAAEFYNEAFSLEFDFKGKMSELGEKAKQMGANAKQKMDSATSNMKNKMSNNQTLNKLGAKAGELKGKASKLIEEFKKWVNGIVEKVKKFFATKFKWMSKIKEFFIKMIGKIKKEKGSGTPIVIPTEVKTYPFAKNFVMQTESVIDALINGHKKEHDDLMKKSEKNPDKAMDYYNKNAEHIMKQLMTVPLDKLEMNCSLEKALYISKNTTIDEINERINKLDKIQEKLKKLSDEFEKQAKEIIPDPYNFTEDDSNNLTQEMHDRHTYLMSAMSRSTSLSSWISQMLAAYGQIITATNANSTPSEEK